MHIPPAFSRVCECVLSVLFRTLMAPVLLFPRVATLLDIRRGDFDNTAYVRINSSNNNNLNNSNNGTVNNGKRTARACLAWALGSLPSTPPSSASPLRWNPINSKDLQAELKLLDGSFPGMAPGVPSPSKHVPCSLHWREEQERKRLQLEAVGRPESPDLTDCAPRGPIVFRREDDE